MRIAVIGGGVSGLVAARLLAVKYEVQLFEADHYAGGHANTVDVDIDGQRLAIDTGFMVFNERTYPNFTRLLHLLGVPSQASDMSFSVSCETTGLEYQGSSLSGLFAQRHNVCRPRFYRMLADIVRFNRQAHLFVQGSNDRLTLEEFLASRRLGAAFRNHYLLPMTAAIWSCPPRDVLGFPALFLLKFMQNHGLLQITDRPQWRTIRGGSRTYVESLTRGLGDRVRLCAPVSRITRHNDHVVVNVADEGSQSFDAVVLATHADTSLKILTDASGFERQLLSSFPYQRNEAVLHTDESWLPRNRRAWASWNYRVSGQDNACVTYDLTRLQNIAATRRLLVTLNPTSEIRNDHILRRFTYHHPVFSCASRAAQERRSEINGQRRTYFCGAYWRHGFHEDGVASALAVVEKFGLGIDSCTAPCITERSSIAELVP